MRRVALAALLATMMAGCTIAPPGQSPMPVFTGPVPTSAITPMDIALRCLAGEMPKDLDLRLAVHSLPDRTGVSDFDGPGAYVTQGAELMLVAAIAKAGVRQVNRTATSIAEWELTQALEKRLGEGSKVLVGDVPVAFRPIQVGYFLGSTHTIYGGITELDFDIVSDGFEAHIAGIGGKARGYYVGIGVDIIVADSRTTEIVLARSYRKQIWGQELEANLFRFWDVGDGGSNVGDFGVELFDLRLGRQQNEPIHQSVRWVVEQAAYEIIRDLGGAGGGCESLVPETSRTVPSEIALARASAPQFATLRPAETPAAAPPAATLDELTDDSAAAREPAADRQADAVSGAEVAAPAAGAETAGRRAVRLPDGKILLPQDR